MTTWRFSSLRPGVVKQHPFLTWPKFMVYKVTNGNFEGDAGFWWFWGWCWKFDNFEDDAGFWWLLTSPKMIVQVRSFLAIFQIGGGFPWKTKSTFLGEVHFWVAMLQDVQDLKENKMILIEIMLTFILRPCLVSGANCQFQAGCIQIIRFRSMSCHKTQPPPSTLKSYQRVYSQCFRMQGPNPHKRKGNSHTIPKITPRKTNECPLKINGWKMHFLLK